MTFEAIRAANIHGVTAAIAAAPNVGWPESGLRILGTQAAGIICNHDYNDFRKAPWTGWSQVDFHYCPQAAWDDWVKLAKLILQIDAAFPAPISEEGG